MEPIIKRERIRDDARQAVATNRLADTCPPEFLPHKDLWIAEYEIAFTEAAVKNQRMPARQAMALADALQEG